MSIRVKSSRQPYRRAGFELSRQWQVIEAIAVTALAILLADPVLQVQRKGEAEDEWLPVTEEEKANIIEASQMLVAADADLNLDLKGAAMVAADAEQAEVEAKAKADAEQAEVEQAEADAKAKADAEQAEIDANAKAEADANAKPGPKSKK